MRESVSATNSIKLDNITLSVNTIQEQVSTMDETVIEIRSDVKDLRKAMYGNGDSSAGLMGRMRSLEEWKDSQVWFQRLVISSLIGEGIGLAILVLHTVTELMK